MQRAVISATFSRLPESTSSRKWMFHWVIFAWATCTRVKMAKTSSDDAFNEASFASWKRSLPKEFRLRQRFVLKNMINEGSMNY